jgi:hypothetical protein
VGDAPVLSHGSLLGILDKNRPLCWNIVVKEKPNVDVSFFGSISSDGVSKETKVVNVHFFDTEFWNFPPAANPVNYTREFREIFEATMCAHNMTGKKT